jgi:CRP-like cAMP-binding protein
VRGKVEIRRGNRRFETVGPNGIFAEMALIDDSPRSATVVALTDVTLAPIQEQQFLFMAEHAPFFALRVMRVLANRLRRQNRPARGVPSRRKGTSRRAPQQHALIFDKLDAGLSSAAMTTRRALEEGHRRFVAADAG